MWFIVLLIICVVMVYFVNNPRKVLNRIVFNLYFSIFYLSYVLVIVIWPFPILNGRNVQNGKIWASLLKHMTKLLGVKWELRNGEMLAKDRGAVIVANHQSTLDIVGMLNVWEIADRLTIIAKRAILYAGPMGIIGYFGGVVFIDRSNPEGAYRQLEVAANVIKNKTKIWVFPEGTRNFDNTKLLPFKKGAFKMAIAAQAPIVPVVYSPYYFVDRKNYILQKGRAIIQCLDEVPTTGLTLDDIPELKERVRNMMLAAYKELSKEVMPASPNVDDEEN